MPSLYLLITILLVASSIDSSHAFNYDFSKQIPFPLQSSPSSCSPSTNLPPNIFTHLAQYSPWFPADRYSPPPQGCPIDQVNILHRHSSRFPTAGAGRIIKSCINRLQTAVHRRGRQSSLSWLLNYRYELGSEDLVELGIQE